MSHEAQARSFAQYRSMGVMTANEVRAARNMSPIEGGDVLQNPYTTTGAPAPDAANDDTPPIPEKDAA